jgi:type VI secretion system protein ImpH
MGEPVGQQKTAKVQSTGPFLSRLTARSAEYEFFQAVRLLCHDSAHQQKLSDQSVGHDNQPHAEIARFRAAVSHRFSAGPVASCKTGERKLGRQPTAESTDKRAQQPDITVNFFGLTGPSGVLPRHYTELLIDRVRQNDFALRDFLDLFHHRMISLFFRAWVKYRLAFQYELAKLEDRQEHDDITRVLLSLVGMETGGLQGRLEFDDLTLIKFGGAFACRVPNATTLQRMLAEQFDLPVAIEQFQPEWLYLEPADQTQLGKPCRLGETTIVGHRVRSIENRFRIVLGPLNYSQFKRFSPDSPQLLAMAQLVRSYIGNGLDFDIQPVLQRSEVPLSVLSATNQGTRLGWNSWIRSRELDWDANDAVFELDGTP